MDFPVLAFNTVCAQWVRNSEGYLRLYHAMDEMIFSAEMSVVASLDRVW